MTSIEASENERPTSRATLRDAGDFDADTGLYRAQLMPEGIVYHSYLAGAKESRFASYWAYEKDRGWIWDIALGGRAGIFRYGTTGDVRPEGFEIDIEGAGLPRLDLEQQLDLQSVDFRFGIPITYGTREYQTKVAFYHLSSHLGDEFLLKHPGYPRLNYSRDVIVWGQSYFPDPDLRFYFEAGWASYSDVSKPWEFQFGLDWAPSGRTGPRGAPFAALNGHLRQELNYGGNVVVQAGWAWRRSAATGLFRAGLEYYNGKDEQFSYYNQSISKVGLALWYDF